MSSIYAKMESPEIIDKIRENLLKRTKTDRLMWFSMWFLLSIITFGLALFPMLYFLIERRNKHFLRQRELESMVLSILKNKGMNLKIEAENLHARNSRLWVLSVFLVAPIFFVAYFLSKDLLLHERRQVAFFRKIFPEADITEQKINLKSCLTVTILTLGVGVIYWFYKIFNSYNNHFKEQWKIEDRIIEVLERKRCV